MRSSIVLTIIILLVGIGIGWRDRQQLVTAQDQRQQLLAEAASCGVVPDVSGRSDAARSNKRVRAGSSENAKVLADELVALMSELEALRQGGGEFDQAGEQRMAALFARLAALDLAGLKLLVGELRERPGIKDETRQYLIKFAILTMANDHPQTALALALESDGLLQGDSGHIVASALARLARDQPLEALEWLRQHGGSLSEPVNDLGKRAVLTGVAAQDPGLALELLDQLELPDKEMVLSNIMGVARTPEQRTATLAALREHLAKMPEDQRGTVLRQTLPILFQGAMREGFAAASEWLERAALSPEELQHGVTALNPYSIESNETGNWVEWLGKSLPAGRADGTIRNLVNHWASTDYQAAGEWLDVAADGPAKDAAVRSYAETVAPFEPSAAAQWALTLPVGEARDATLNTIYRTWAAKDPVAAAEFATQQGIK